MKKYKSTKSDWIVRSLYALNIAIILILGLAIWLFYNKPEYIKTIANLF
ncbi:hypothetical protein [Bacillus sp. FJAT-18017]|nr:hypothetical protein [Bacillus sp. FJAT-18017]